MRIRIALLLVAVFFSANTFAAGALSAVTVSYIRVDQDDRGVVIFNAASTGGTPPGCVNPAYVNALAFNAGTDGGKAALAVFLTAKNTGAQVWVYGLGTCSIYPTNVEDLNYVVSQ